MTAQNERLLFDEHGNPTPRADKFTCTPMGRFGESNELVEYSS